MGEDRDDFARLDARYRRYLLFLVRTHVEPELQGRVDVEGVVQQTLLEAWRSAPERAGWAGWLRRLLAHNLTDALREIRAGKRDVAREQALDDQMTASSAKLADFLATKQSSPSARLAREERAIRVAAALEQLPPAQREALVLQHWHGWSLDQIATHMERTPAAVAGLLKRGLRQLRVLLSDLEER